MIMFILDIMVPQVELDGVYTDCANVSNLPVTVQKLASSVDAFDYRVCDLDATAGSDVGGGVALSRNYRSNQSKKNGANGGKNDNEISDIPWNSMGEAGDKNCKLRYKIAQHNPPPSPTISESTLEIKLWMGITKPL